MFKKAKRIHFVGIGGIGMSGIAELLMNLKFHITGSDINQSQNVKRLESRGINISINHSADNIKNADVVVYSSAVKQNNPELIAAHKRNIPIIRRAEMLAELISLKQTSIAVGGTHGKTTTSSMIGTMLEEAGYDPTLVVGGLVSNLNSNVKLGSGDVIVVEADEYEGVDGVAPSGEWKHFKTKPSTKNDSYSTKRDTNVFKLENLKII